MMTNAQQIYKVVLNAHIKRADGTTEELGPIAEYHSNPKKRSRLLPELSIKNMALFQKYLNTK